MSDVATWGSTYVWSACGHQAMVIGDHDAQHYHYCPVCEPGRRDDGCTVEYLDAADSGRRVP